MKTEEEEIYAENIRNIVRIVYADNEELAIEKAEQMLNDDTA